MKAIKYFNEKIYVPELTVAEYLEYQKMHSEATEDRHNFDRLYIDVLRKFARTEKGDRAFVPEHSFDHLNAKTVMTVALAFQKALQKVNDIAKDDIEALLKN
ncbi:MAG: hypothetical protein ACRC2T_12385 [Thermoguttaceae bacterium]